MSNPKLIDDFLLDNLIYRNNEISQLLFNGDYAIQHLAKSIYDDLINSEADADYKPINLDLRLATLIAISLLGENLSDASEKLEKDTHLLKNRLLGRAKHDN